MVSTPLRAPPAPQFPIVRAFDPDLWPHEDERLRRDADRLLASDPGIISPRWDRPDLSPGWSDGPALVFEDHSEIALATGAQPELDYRMAFLAGAGDAFVLPGPRIPSFEHYIAHDLGLGESLILEASAHGPDPIPMRCATDPTFLRSIRSIAGRSGALTLVPYIGLPGAWILGERIANATGLRIRVAAPRPDLAYRVNSKLWFAQRARHILGPRSIPPTSVASDARELSVHIDALASEHGTLVVKVPSSSGGRGIVMVDAIDVRPARARALVERIHQQLASNGWPGTYPLLVGAWERSVYASPSAQVWVPEAAEDVPVVEAVFDQRLHDDGLTFTGGTVSGLPMPMQRRIARESMLLARFLQHLGYFGRCSFDAILTGPDVTRDTPRWVECNGRWGGASTALSAVNRLVGDWREHPFTVIQTTAPTRPCRSFEDVLAIVGDDGFHRRGDGAGVVVLSPRRMIAGSGVNVIVLGSTMEQTHEMTRRIMSRFTSG
jgi:hypothetical protein